MNTETNFRTVAGYCQVQNEAILFTKRKHDFDNLGHPISKEIFSGFQGLILLGILLIYNTFSSEQSNTNLTIIWGVFMVFILIITLYKFKYSRQCEIPKESITEIRFVFGIPGITNNRVFLKYITDGKELETMITLPFTFKTKEALTSIKQIFINQGYSVNN